MKGSPLIILLISIFVIGFVAENAVAKGPNSKTLSGYEVSKLLGRDVENPQGERLGKVTDFMLDSGGRIAFAILLQSGSKTGKSRYVAVPFEELSYRPSPHRFVLNSTSERLASAPSYDQKKALTDPKFADDVYRYFGLEPYWTEQGHEKWFRSDQDPFDLVG